MRAARRRGPRALLRPELVGVSVSTPTYDADVETIGRLCAWTDAHLAAIGVHVTALPHETLQGSQLDSVVRGEPEWTVTELAETLAQVGDLGAVAGLSLRRGGGIVPTRIASSPTRSTSFHRRRAISSPNGARPAEGT